MKIFILNIWKAPLKVKLCFLSLVALYIGTMFYFLSSDQWLSIIMGYYMMLPIFLLIIGSLLNTVSGYLTKGEDKP